MKRRILSKLLVLTAMSFTLFGCNDNKEEPIANDRESTIIKNAKNTDEFVKKEDYKSVAYAFIYNIKSGLRSYESESNGTIKAKVLFFDYDIKYNSVLHKNGSTFYSKDDSTSTLMNVQNEFYMVDKEKILVSRDMKNYSVYTLEDYHKTSYSFDQYLIMGYTFNDQSILKSELVSNSDDAVEIKYTLDNHLSTSWVAVDLKVNGGLSSYPDFKTIELSLKMKKDFTPISYAIHAVYDASKPILGTSEVTQDGICRFSKVNEAINIPNEASLIEKLGSAPSEINLNNEEDAIKNDLLGALEALDWKNGVNVGGDLSLNLLGNETKLHIGTNLSFDTSRLSSEKIYSILSFYAVAEGDDTFNTILSLVKSFAGEELGEYGALLKDFKKLEIIYDGEGGLYLVPTNQSDVQPLVLKTKLVDILDIVLKQVNVYELVTGANSDLFSFSKKEGKDEKNYQVEIALNEETIESIRYGLNKVFENEKYSMLKTVLSYQDFDSLPITLGIVDGALKDVDVSFCYLKGAEGQEAEVATLAKLHLEAKNETFGFAEKIAFAQDLYQSYQSILALKARLEELLKNVYVSQKYLSNLQEAYAEYKELDEAQKSFFKANVEGEIQNAIKSVGDILLFLQTYRKYDVSHLSNEDILDLAKAYHLNTLNGGLLLDEIGQENYAILSDLANALDYSSFDGALAKIEGDDETSWGLTEQEIRDIHLLFEISEYESAVATNIWMKLLLGGKSIEVETLKQKINSLYDNL